MLPLHETVVHGTVRNTLPAAQSSIRARPTLSVAFAATLMLLPVHTLLVGFVMATVGRVVSVVVEVEFDTVTVRVVDAVALPESVTVAVSVTDPFSEVVVFQVKPLLLPL